MMKHSVRPTIRTANNIYPVALQNRTDRALHSMIFGAVKSGWACKGYRVVAYNAERRCSMLDNSVGRLACSLKETHVFS